MFKGLRKKKTPSRNSSPRLSVDSNSPAPSTSTPTPTPTPTSGLLARFSNSNASSIRDFGVASEQNPAFRQTMEDTHVMIDGFFGHTGWTYVALHDGHGGNETSELAARRLHKYLAAGLRSGHSVAEAIKHAYIRTDEEAIDLGHDVVGSTAVTCILHPSNTSFIEQKSTNIRSDSDSEDDVPPPVQLTVGNAGDSSAFLVSKSRIQELTVIHRPSDPSEATRVVNAGGFILSNRVNGSLAVTRALGDGLLKPSVIADPSIRSVVLTEHDEALILVCDGVTDVLSNEDIRDIFQKSKHKGAQQTANILVKISLERGTTDNISVMVLLL
ncbi:hypothetical protein GEMRC1_009330 [Eukaryota sp. GEM-RC1]